MSAAIQWLVDLATSSVPFLEAVALAGILWLGFIRMGWL